MGMYIARRLFWLPVLLFAVSLITFYLFRVAPGDPVTVMLGAKARPEAAERLRQELGLDRPFWVQYSDYVFNFAMGDFGESLRYPGQSVKDLIIPKMWVSAQLSFVALAISVIFGLPLGFYVAHKQGHAIDPIVIIAALSLMAILPMISVPTLLWIFCLKLGWVPCSGWGGIWDTRIIIPAITLGTPGIAFFVRLMRASTLDVLGQDFVRTAKSKGLGIFTIDARHVLRNAIIPIVTILAFSLAGLIGGALITERILGIPGIGYFAVESVFQRDFPVLMAITMIAATFFVIGTLLADICYTLIDPRIRYN